MNPDFETIKQAREWLIGQAELRAGKGISPPSDVTVADYRQVMKVLLKKGDPWIAAANTTKKSTYFKRRAAILHCTREVIEARLKAQDQLQRNNGLSDPVKRAAWDEHVRAIKNAFILVEKIPDEPPMENVSRRKTKRKNLGKLPKDWREQLMNRMPNYEAAMAVTSLSGCRPVELKRSGALVSFRGNELKVQILGAKVGDKSGQKWREMTFEMPTENPIAMRLGRLVLLNKEDLLVKIDSEVNFTTAIRSAGQRAFPSFPDSITAYSLRHQVASDLKASDLSPDQVSQALGHSSGDTKGSYGIHSQGTGTMAPGKVEAERQVKNGPAKPLPGAVKQRTGPRRP